MAITGNVNGLVQILSTISPGSSPGTQAVISLTITGTNYQCPSVDLPAAKTGALTTRTSDTVGTMTTTQDHVLAGTETLAFFWDDPSTGASKCAYECAITGHTDDTVTFSVGAGDVLPAGPVDSTPGTSMTVAVCQRISSNVSIPGSTNLLQLQITSPKEGWCNLRSTGGASLGPVEVASAITPTAPYIWPKQASATPPYTNTIVAIDCYNAETTVSTMTIEANLL